MPLFRFFSLFALTLSVPAWAADQAPAATQPAAPAAAPAEKLICRKTPEIGSLIRVKKECATKSEWRRRDMGARDATRDLQSVGGSSTNQ